MFENLKDMKQLSDNIVETQIERFKAAWRNTAKQPFVDGFSAGYHYTKYQQNYAEFKYAYMRLSQIDSRSNQRGTNLSQEWYERTILTSIIQSSMSEGLRHWDSFLRDIKANNQIRH